MRTPRRQDAKKLKPEFVFAFLGVLASWRRGVLAFAFHPVLMRLFLALELTQDVRKHLLEVRKRLEPALPEVSYTRAENLHLTLKFLGDVAPKRLPAITESLALIKSQRIELAGDGIDCFPNRGPIRIVTARLNGTLSPLRALVESIEQRCKFLGASRKSSAPIART